MNEDLKNYLNETLQKGIQFLKFNMNEEAKKCFQDILKHEPYHANTLNLLGITFIKLKKFSGVAIDNTGSFRMKDKVYYDKKTNFILTDHQAGVSTNLERRKNLIFKNIDNYYKKRKPGYLKTIKYWLKNLVQKENQLQIKLH